MGPATSGALQKDHVEARIVKCEPATASVHPTEDGAPKKELGETWPGTVRVTEMQSASTRYKMCTRPGPLEAHADPRTWYHEDSLGAVEEVVPPVHLGSLP